MFPSPCVVVMVQAESEAGEDGEYYGVELQRGTRGFGFSIRGGREFHNMPLFVLRIAENGPAAEDGKLKVKQSTKDIHMVIINSFYNNDYYTFMDY